MKPWGRISGKPWTKYKADSNLHSVPAYENIYAIKGIVEKAGIDNQANTLLAEIQTHPQVIEAYLGKG